MCDDLLMNIHVDDAERRLVVTRPKVNKSGALSPCDMSPDDVDYEMSFPKDRRILEICGMNQESFEYFVEKYGESYESLYFFKCQLISDLSPLSRLKNLKALRVYWNIRSKGLWDMSENRALRHLIVTDSKSITRDLSLLQTGKSLTNVTIYGSGFEHYPLADLSVFADLPCLEALSLGSLKIQNRNLDFLKTLPRLTEFQFDPGMFTTEEIAYIRARYPDIWGDSLGPYTAGVLTDVRVCGYRKPAFDLPEGQARLDRYIADFWRLVEKYKSEELE